MLFVSLPDTLLYSIRCLIESVHLLIPRKICKILPEPKRGKILVKRHIIEKSVKPALPLKKSNMLRASFIDISMTVFRSVNLFNFWHIDDSLLPFLCFSDCKAHEMGSSRGCSRIPSLHGRCHEQVMHKWTSSVSRYHNEPFSLCANLIWFEKTSRFSSQCECKISIFSELNHIQRHIQYRAIHVQEGWGRGYRKCTCSNFF